MRIRLALLLASCGICSGWITVANLRPAVRVQPQIGLRTTQPQVGLTEESLARIHELVVHDMQLVMKTTQRDPRVALDLAYESAQRRLPIATWLLAFTADQLKFKALEAKLQVAQTLAPLMTEELTLEREQLLKEHMTRLRGALRELQPVVKQRLVQAAREQPKLIPSMAASLVRSGVYKLYWGINRRAAPLRSVEAYQTTRMVLVDKWLARCGMPYPRTPTHLDPRGNPTRN